MIFSLAPIHPYSLVIVIPFKRDYRKRVSNSYKKEENLVDKISYHHCQVLEPATLLRRRSWVCMSFRLRWLYKMTINLSTQPNKLQRKNYMFPLHSLKFLFLLHNNPSSITEWVYYIRRLFFPQNPIIDRGKSYVGTPFSFTK